MTKVKVLHILGFYLKRAAPAVFVLGSDPQMNI